METFIATIEKGKRAEVADELSTKLGKAVGVEHLGSGQCQFTVRTDVKDCRQTVERVLGNALVKADLDA